ncbi:MAG: hypothetical protein P4M14_10365 [Gammaproteobacteria bacterium]|nr:hypothetical protein [Gammaproteobacteria bacterium]
MSSPRQFDGLTREISERFFAQLLKSRVSEQAANMRMTLDQTKEAIPLNPGRAQPFTWSHKDLSDNVKDILSISVVLDDKFASRYTSVETKLRESIAALNNNKYNIVNLEMSLADQLLTEHVKRETTDVQYHRDPHPKESAVLASKIEMINLNGQKSSPEEKARAASAFAVHDAEYGEMADGLNEINSAALLYQAKMESYTAFQSAIANDNTLSEANRDAAIDAIEQYKNMIAYEAWKTIVAGTTMLKKIDGQPTIFTAQKLGVDAMLGKKPEAGNALDRQTMIMSMVDSNFAAFIKQLQQDAVMGQYLPSSLLQNTPPDIQAILFNPKGANLESLSVDRTVVDTAGLLYGQNERMFPEIHAAYKAALFKSSFDVRDETGQVIRMDGVTLWNKTMEAARKGDAELLDKYLSVGTNVQIDIPAFPPGATPPPSIVAGSTLQDIFIHRIGGEIQFAKGQGPELYQKLADNLGFEHPDIAYKVWSDHAVQLENLRDRYNANSTEKRFEISKALFHIASHQPGVYLDADKRLQHIEVAILDMEDLEKRKSTLQEKDHRLTSEIEVLERRINVLQPGEGGADAASKAKDPTLKNSTNAIAKGLFTGEDLLAQTRLGQVTTELQTKKKEHTTVKEVLDVVSKAIEERPQQLLNLLRTQAELRKVMPVPAQEKDNSNAYKV